MAAIQPHMMDCLVNIQTPAPSSLWSNSNTHLARLHSGSPVTYKTSGGCFTSQITDQCDQFVQDQFTCIHKENRMCDSLTLTTGRKKWLLNMIFSPKLNMLQIQTLARPLDDNLHSTEAVKMTKKSYLGHGYECVYIHIYIL